MANSVGWGQGAILNNVNWGQADFGGGLLVYGGGTDIENATELQAVYNFAKTQLPSATNVLTVVVSPGNYNFQDNNFTLDTEYINVVSLDGNQSVIFNGVNINEDGDLTYNLGTISVNTGNVLVVGINTLTKAFVTGSFATMVIENCRGGDNSFGFYGTVSGTFNYCRGGDNSFGYGGYASGTFNYCTGKNGSFGGYGTANGTFNNCTGAEICFAYNGTASGTFNYCTGGNYAFGVGLIASGTFNNCTGGIYAFGGNGGTLSGKLYYCRLTQGTFETISAGGRTVLCIDGNNNPNNQ